MTYLIGIAGGSGSGKGTIAELIEKHLTCWGVKTVVLSADDCYKDLSYIPRAERDLFCFNPEFNFDHPKSVDFDRLVRYATELKDGREFSYAQYDFSLHAYGAKKVKVMGGLDVAIIEGIYTLYSGSGVENSLLSLYNHKIFVVTTPEIAQNRRIRRDVTERGRELSHVLRHLDATVIPMHRKFIYPTQVSADDVIDWRVDETQGADAVKKQLVAIARQKAMAIYERVREPLLSSLELGEVVIKGIG